MRLHHRIIMAFAVLFVLFAVLAGLAVTFVDRAARSTADLHQNGFASIQALGDVRNRILEIKSAVLMHMAFPHDMRHADLRSELLRLEQIAEEKLALATSRMPQQSTDMDGVWAAWTALRGHVDVIVAMLENQRVEHAHEIYHQVGHPLFNQALDRVTDAVLAKSGQALQTAEDAETLREDLLWTVAAAALTSLLVGAAAVGGVSFGISRPLRRQYAALQRMAAGDLHTPVPYAERRDEIGDIARAIDTLRREAADKARTELQFQIIFKASPDIVTISEMQTGRFLDVNAGFERLLGWSRDEAVGNSSTDLNIWATSQDRQRLVAALRQNGRLENFKARARRRNGEEFDGLVSAEQFVLAGVPCMILVARDISEMLRQEETLLQTVTELEQSNSQLERFVHAAAHDLMEPSRIIAGFAQLLERSEPDLSEDGKEYLQFLTAGAARMRAQVQGLQEYALLAQKNGEFTRIDMDKALDEALLRLKIDQTGAQIHRPPQLPAVLGIHEQAVQLFTHLIGNGIKFQPAGKTAHIDINVETKGDSDKHVFVVTDDGIGLDPGFETSIFEIFRRLHGPQSYPGAGIGLTLAQRIVRRHGGHITAGARADGKNGLEIRFDLAAA